MTFTAPAMQSAARPIGVASVRGLAVISLEYSAGCVSPVFTRPQSQRPGFRCAAEPAAPQQQQQEVQPDSLTACDMSGPHMDCYLMADGETALLFQTAVLALPIPTDCPGIIAWAESASGVLLLQILLPGSPSSKHSTIQRRPSFQKIWKA